MFRRLRTSFPARLALCLAGLLAVTGAFGLHPEGPLRATDAVDAPEISRAAQQTAPHACPACLTHGAALIGPAAAFSLSADLSRPATRVDSPAILDRLAGRDLSGRSPPERS